MRKFVLFLLVAILSGCQKDLQELPYEKLALPQVATYRDASIFTADEFIVCGGDASGIIYKTSDGGETWVSAATNFENPVNCIYFLNSDTGFCADSDILIYKTVDGGINWNLFYADSWPLTVNRNLRSIWFNTDSTGFVCGGKNYGNGVLYQTDNGGLNWSYNEFAHEYRGICFSDRLNGVLCGYGSLMITNDGGKTFTNIGNGSRFYTGVCLDPYANFWMCDFDGNIYQSADNGSNWNRVKESTSWNVDGFHLNCIAASPSGRIACAGPNGFITWSDDNGANWHERESFGGKDILRIRWIDDNILLATGKDGGVFRVVL